MAIIQNCVGLSSRGIKGEFLVVLESGVKCCLQLGGHKRSLVVLRCPVGHVQLNLQNVLCLNNNKITTK